MASESSSNDPLAEFGANQWLVDELFEKYQEDKHSVDEAWWPFFAGYTGDGAKAPAAQGTTSVMSRSGKPAARTGAGRTRDAPAAAAPAGRT